MGILSGWCPSSEHRTDRTVPNPAIPLSAPLLASAISMWTMLNMNEGNTRSFGQTCSMGAPVPLFDELPLQGTCTLPTTSQWPSWTGLQRQR